MHRASESRIHALSRSVHVCVMCFSSGKTFLVQNEATATTLLHACDCLYYITILYFIHSPCEKKYYSNCYRVDWDSSFVTILKESNKFICLMTFPVSVSITHDDCVNFRTLLIPQQFLLVLPQRATH